MLDQIESWENAAERRYDEMSQGDGKLKCDCGKIFDPNEESGTLNPNPYSMPGCGDCLESTMKDYTFLVNLTEEQIDVLKNHRKNLQALYVTAEDIYKQVIPEYNAIKKREIEREGR